MADGKDCKCSAHGECECGCGADWTPQEIYDLRSKLKEAENTISEAHAILDGDESKIIRNVKDGYLDGRPDRVLTLAERVKALCKYGSDYVRWLKESEARLSHLMDVAERMSSALEAQIEIWQCCEEIITDWDKRNCQVSFFELHKPIEKAKLSIAEWDGIKNG